MSELRREMRLNQRQASKLLGISQALLSHYENGTREPKFEFVHTACEFFGVTSDYLLGRSDERKTGAALLSEEVQDILTALEELRDTETALLDELSDVISKELK